MENNNVFMNRNNETTLSVYCYTVTAKCYNEETETISVHTFNIFNERVPSDSIIKSELEKNGYTVLGKVSVSLNTDLSGLYKMNHYDFMIHAFKVGDVRPKKEKENK